MAFSVAQHNATTQTLQSTFTTTWDQATAAGNLLVAVVVAIGNPTISNAQGWTQAVTVRNGVNLQIDIWYKAASGASEANPAFAIGASLSGSLSIAEIGGVDILAPLDRTGTATGSAVTTLAVSSGSTIRQGNEFVLAGIGMGAVLSWSAPSSSPSGVQVIDNIIAVTSSEDAWNTSDVTGTTPSITFNWSGSLSPVAVMATFLPSPPVRSAAGVMVTESKGRRASRRRNGFWHTIAHKNSTVLGEPETPTTTGASTFIQAGRRGRAARRRSGNWYYAANNSQTVFRDNMIASTEDRTWRARVPRFANWYQVARELFPFWPPFVNNAGNLILSTLGRRVPRRRGGFWHTIAHSNQTVLGEPETPQHNISDTYIQGAQKGRPARRRVGMWHRASTETQTIWRDQALSVPRQRSWRRPVPRLVGWYTSVALRLAAILPWSYPLLFPASTAGQEMSPQPSAMLYPSDPSTQEMLPQPAPLLHPQEKD